MKIVLFIGFCLVAASLAIPAPGLLDGLLSGVTGLLNGLLGSSLGQVNSTIGTLSNLAGGLTGAVSPALSGALESANETLANATTVLTQAQDVPPTNLSGPAQTQLANSLMSIKGVTTGMQGVLARMQHGAVNDAATGSQVDALNGLTGTLGNVVNSVSKLLE